jgi:hypothetical protein
MDDDKLQAYKDAALELGTAIAMGAVPVLGQAIDAYDTIESAWRVYGAKVGEDKENAQFDLVLALVGWVPGPGDGVKKSLRLVNRDPERFAPILFDLLRRVCEIAGIHTSPEALLDGLFDAAYLQAQMAEIRKGVEDYPAFKALPETSQAIVRSVLQTAQTQLPAMVGIVQRRLVKWKAVQRNSSAAAGAHGRAKTAAPQPRDPQVAREGEHRPVGGAPGQTLNSTAATAALELGNALLGVAGEHIGDYFCAEHLSWGRHWSAHDRGGQGQWSEAPGPSAPGKLSQGGDPRTPGALYRLGDRAAATGIDAVWSTGGQRNAGLPYAVVEYKSDFEFQMPSFIKKNPATGRKPGITGKLGVSAFHYTQLHLSSASL